MLEEMANKHEAQIVKINFILEIDWGITLNIKKISLEPKVIIAKKDRTGIREAIKLYVSP